MKKNAMLKIAAILMVAVLLTTCAISSTFAKYTTSGDYSDMARVAKFGVKVNTKAEALFKDAYKGTGDFVNDDTVKIADGSITYSKVVAPGTSGSVSSVMTVTGTPEVAVRVAYDAEVELGDNWIYKEKPEDTGTVYCPIVFTINGKTYGVQGCSDVTLDHSYTSVAALEQGIEGFIEAWNAVYAPNATLETAKDKDGNTINALSIEWAWDFDTTEDTYDVMDTYLGDQAADGTDISITIELTTTVTQID